MTDCPRWRGGAGEAGALNIGRKLPHRYVKGSRPQAQPWPLTAFRRRPAAAHLDGDAHRQHPLQPRPLRAAGDLAGGM